MPLVKKQNTNPRHEDDDDALPRVSEHPPQIDPQFTILRSDGFTSEVLNVPSADTPPPPPPPQDTDPSIAYGMSYPESSLAVPSTQPPISHEDEVEPDPFPASSYNGEPLDPQAPAVESSPAPESRKSSSRLSGVFHRKHSRSRSAINASEEKDAKSPAKEKERRLSAIFHRHRSGSRSSRSTSPPLPPELEDILDGEVDPEDTEAQWERRATVLAQHGGPPPPAQPQQQLPQPQQPTQQLSPNQQTQGLQPPRPAQGRSRSISDAKSDDDIQKAIQLHESGELEQSTAMFGRLADPNGANNALSQVLYGLALRHGWGIATDPTNAVSYLSLAARNSAAVEAQALAAGMKRGGAAKGELVLAIYELANCYKMGLGVPKDPVAARRYFETAARLGDVDALEAAARCYEEGYGGKKDKFMAAKYYRQAEEKGHKIVGNSWIWKDKYNPKPSAGT